MRMQEETNLATDIMAFFTKLSSYLMPLILGLFGKIGNILYSQRHLTCWQIVGVIFISLWYGWIASVACEVYKWEHVRHILPGAATMLGEYVNTWFIQNYKRLLNGLFRLFINKNEK